MTILFAIITAIAALLGSIAEPADVGPDATATRITTTTTEPEVATGPPPVPTTTAPLPPEPAALEACFGEVVMVDIVIQPGEHYWSSTLPGCDVSPPQVMVGRVDAEFGLHADPGMCASSLAQFGALWMWDQATERAYCVGLDY